MVSGREEDHTAMPGERQREILKYIDKWGSGQIKELARAFKVSQATIRRDLDELDEEGFLERTRGGALMASCSTSFEQIHSEKMSLMLEEKHHIAQKAASLVKEGDTLYLDSGTTTFFIGQKLAAIKNLTVVTHDLNIANAIMIHPSSTLILTGGTRREGYNVLVGAVTENLIRQLKVNLVFLGADGVDLDFGISNANFVEVGIKQMLLQSGRKVILVSDTSKFGRTALAKVCGIEDVDMIITGSKLDRTLIEKIQKQTELVLATG